MYRAGQAVRDELNATSSPLVTMPFEFMELPVNQSKSAGHGLRSRSQARGMPNMHDVAAGLCAVALTLTGCAATGENYRPIVDTKNASGNYENDLRECQQFATQTAGAGQSAATGAVAGAVFGALLAAAAGGGYSRSNSAAVGGITGGVAAGAGGETNQRNIIRRCLAGRGYNVLQ